MLVSDGAHTYAELKGIETIPPENMISPNAKSEWQKWKQRLEKNETHPTQESTSIHNIQDTVGAVAWADSGGIATGVSRRVP
jgi:taspase (threonine aspartase 1)